MKEKINSLQFSSMMLLIVLASYLGIGLYSSLKVAKVNAWISVLWTALLGVIILLVMKTIFNYEPDLPINKKIEKLFGKKMGLILNILLIINVLGMGTSALYNLTHFISSQFLPQTPKILIASLFSIVIWYINTKNLEVLSRVSFILTIINLFLFFTAIGGLAPQIDFLNYKPILENGIKDSIFGGIYITIFNFFPIFLLLIVPKNNISDKDKVIKYSFITYLISIFLMFLVIFVTLGVLGPDLSRIYQYPEYIVLKRINFFNFVDRIENIINIQWIFGLYFYLSLVVFYLNKSIKPNSKKLLPFIITFVNLIATFLLFKNNVAYNAFSYNILPYIRGSFIILLLITSVVIKVKTKKTNG